MKKIIALLLAVVMCLSLCACAGEEETTRKKDKNKESGNAYEEYEDLLEYLEAEDYESALRYIQELYDEQQANLPDVPADAEELYQHVLWALECYEDGSNIWIDEMDESIGGAELTQYIYENLTALGEYKDCQELLGRFTIVENVHLSTVRTDVDNLGNENQYGSERTYGALGHMTVLRNPMSSEMETHIFGYDFWGSRYYAYDDEGRIGAIECGYIYDNSRDINALISFHYDDAGRLVKLETNTSGGDSYYTEFSYDDNGTVTKITASGGYYTYVTEYTYNETGALVKEVRERFYGSGMDLDGRTTLEYTLDDNGVATGYTELIQDSYSSYYKQFYSNRTNVHVFTLDGQGRVIMDQVTYGMIIDREGNESKPDSVSSVYEYSYGDYYIYE